MNAGLERIENCIDLVCGGEQLPLAVPRICDWGMLCGLLETGVREFFEEEFGVVFVGRFSPGAEGSHEAYMQRLSEPVQSAIASQLAAVDRLAAVVSQAPFTMPNAVRFIESVGLHLPAAAAVLHADAKRAHVRITEEMEEIRRQFEDRRTRDPREERLFERAEEILRAAFAAAPDVKRPMEQKLALTRANDELRVYSRDEWLALEGSMRDRFKARRSRARNM